jgi:serine phosphatase RsbU (regulator of sigma subunit)/ligand-binding sensor domain-containing protein
MKLNGTQMTESRGLHMGRTINSKLATSYHTVRYSVLCTCVLIAVNCTASDNLLDASRWRYFNDPRDIPGLSISAIVQDMSEMLWLATADALVKYNGSEFIREVIPGAPRNLRFQCLLLAADGTLWVGTNGGLLRFTAQEWDYPLRSGNVTALTESADGIVYIGISPDGAVSFVPEIPPRRTTDRPMHPMRAKERIVSTVYDQPVEFVVETAGVFTCRRGVWKRCDSPVNGLPDAPVYTLFADFDGGVWAIFGTRDYTVAVLRHYRGSWHDLRRKMSLPSVPILSVAQTPDGTYWLGTRNGVWRYQVGSWESFNRRTDMRGFTAASLLPMPDGSIWAAGEPAGVIHKFTGHSWQSFTVRDVGLSGQMLTHFMYAIDDAFWVAIPGRGGARFDRRGGPWWVYGEEHGLPLSASVNTVAQGDGERVWFGTSVGVYIFENGLFVRPRQLSHLTNSPISALEAVGDDTLWLASSATDARSGIWQMSRNTWSRVAVPMAIRDALIPDIHRTKSGDIWIATNGLRRPDSGDEVGLFRLSGGQWTRFTTADGLPSNRILSIDDGPDSTVWVGTTRGIASFDSSGWRVYTNDDGLTATYATAVCAASDSSIWVGGTNPDQGVSRYWRGQWTTFDVDTGLVSHDIWSITEAPDQSIWVGTALGVGRYDGTFWSTFNARNGLAAGNVVSACASENGSIWLGHFDGKVTRFHATSGDAPQVSLDRLPERVAYPGFLSINWQGRDRWDRTQIEELYYSWRMDEGEWSRFSRATRNTFPVLPSGHHTFFVRALDQEGNISSRVASADFDVDLPFWLTLWFLVPTFIGTSGIAVFASTAAQRNRKLKLAQAQLVGELEKELEVAHRMQTDLLPQHDPDVPGLEVTGLCRPAKQVGGDYFTYLWSESGGRRLGVVIADVTGHAMEAAIPAVLFSGMLAATSAETGGPADMLSSLNDSLEQQTSSHTFICCTIAVVDLDAMTLRLANAGGLDPILRRGTDVTMIEVDGPRLPLGMVPGIRYEEHETHLSRNDTLVLLTDGLVEARSPEGEMFGFDRIIDIIRESETTGDIRDNLLYEAGRHLQMSEPDDDITLLALKVCPLTSPDDEASDSSHS